MFRQAVLLLLALTLCGSGMACKKKPAGNLAEQTKAFQERQRNEAIKAYKALAEKYPDSPHAATAQERLKQLGPPSTPAKKK